MASTAESFEKTARVFQATCYSKFVCKCSTRVAVTFSPWWNKCCAFCFNLWDSINTSVKRSMAKLYKIKLVKQQSFNFSHNLLKRCLVLRQDYVEKWQGQFSSFSFQAHAHSKSERSVSESSIKYSPIFESNLAPFGSLKSGLILPIT